MKWYTWQKQEYAFEFEVISFDLIYNRGLCRLFS